MKKYIVLAAIAFIGCRNKVGQIDLTGTVYKYHTDGGYSSLQLGTYVLTISLIISAYYIGKMKSKSRNQITNSESFYLFICGLFLLFYILALPLLFILY